MAKIKKESIEVTQVINEYGELIDTTTKKRFVIDVPKQDSYYSAFIEFMAPYFSLSSANAKDLCQRLCCIAEYNTGKVDISTAVRVRLCEEMGINNDNLSTYIKMLKDKNILKNGKYKGEYLINPLMFWKGENKLRADAVMEFSVEFTAIPKENNKENLEK